MLYIKGTKEIYVSTKIRENKSGERITERRGEGKKINLSHHAAGGSTYQHSK